MTLRLAFLMDGTVKLFSDVSTPIAPASRIIGAPSPARSRSVRMRSPSSFGRPEPMSMAEDLSEIAMIFSRESSVIFDISQGLYIASGSFWTSESHIDFSPR